jgi:hypothetical protein
MLQNYAIALICLGCGFALLNWLMLYLTWHTGRFHSCIPLIGGLSLGLGLLWFPTTRLFAWAALVLDWGTLVVLLALPQLLKELWSTSRFNLLEQYEGQRDGRSAQLQLFRRGVFTIRFKRTHAADGMVELGTVGTWRREEGWLALLLWNELATFEPLAGRGGGAIVQTTGFRADQDDVTSLAGIELRLIYRKTI